jgi:hypothetical protein
MLKHTIRTLAAMSSGMLVGLAIGLMLAPYVGSACALTQAQARVIQTKADTIATELQERLADALKPLP